MERAAACDACLRRRLLAAFTLASAALGLVLAASPVAADDPRSLRFKHLSRDQGLSQSFVYAITQDREGYMWFGTQEGLNCFDGYGFTVFAHDPNDPQSLSDESVRTIVEDQAGDLWIGTDAGGLSRYDKMRGTFENFLHDPANPASISSNRVRVVYEDSRGVLWIGTDGAGLERFDRDAATFTHYPHDPSVAASLSNPHVWSIIEDSEGTLWVGTNDGLNKLDSGNGSFLRYTHDPDAAASLSDSQVRVLFEDQDKVLWIGTEQGGLNRFDRTSGAFETFVHDPSDASSISANRIRAIYEDSEGVLWIGTDNGLNAWNPDARSFERYFHEGGDPYSLSHDNVLSIFEDRGKLLWVGTYEGLSVSNQSARAMAHYKHNTNDSQSLSENTVTSFAEDARSRIWVGTFDGGLNLLDRETDHFSHIRHEPGDNASLSSDRVMALHVDHNDTLWVGTRDAGLNRYAEDSQTFTRYRHDPDDPSSLSADGITYILEDSNGALWIGTFGGGLNRFDRATARFERFRSEPDNPATLGDDRVLVLFEDRGGMIWIGTYGGGLNRLDPATGQFTRYGAEPERRDGLTGDEIFMIEEDSRGGLWIGVKGGGLHHWPAAERELDRPSFQRFSELDGLPSATIYSGVWDQAGHLWLSTARGLSKLDTDTLQFRNFDPSHGLQGHEFNLAAGFRAANGQLLFGGMNGFNAFQPESFATNGHAPQVVIANVLGLNSPLDLSETRSSGGPLRLDYQQNVIGFEFAALDYAAPEKNRFMYQLEGFDDDWVDAGTRHRVTYTNLPAGDYTFRVKAANNNGIWSTRDAELDFYMQPAPWNTWWAYLVYVVALGAILLAALRLHARKTEQAAKLKYAEELAVVQARLNEAQRIAQVGNWDWNTVTNELWWSDEIYRLFQLDRDAFDATFESFLEHVHPEDRDTVNQAVERALSGQEDYSTDHRIIRPDGSERIVHEQAEVTFDAAGQPIRLAGTVHDITERKKAENDVRHRADFQALLARLSSELIRAQPDDIDSQMSDGLKLVGTQYALDAISIWWIAAEQDRMHSEHRWVRVENRNRKYDLDRTQVSWVAEQLRTCKCIIFDDIEQMPPEAAADKKLLRERGTKSILIIPLLVDKTLRGACAYSVFREKRAWTAEAVAELKLIAENLAGAIGRSKAVAEIKQLKEKLQVENIFLREEVRFAHGFAEIVGEDHKLRRCLAAVEKVAPTDTAVLVLGETGTGKELIARAVHNLSARRDRPMIAVNCPALPAEIIESELFGHEKGAFTGAQAQRRGRFELADKGTIFLDEIGELPLDLQSKLLRVLQTGKFERLGGSETLHVDVRLIAATNRNLHAAVDRGEFRADLYYRISSFPIPLPPLRERRGDIPLLAEHFVHKHAKRLGKEISAISAQMIRELVAYSWPGNIRELESTVERALISSGGGSVLEVPGPIPWIISMDAAVPGLSEGDSADLTSVERAHIINVLDQTRWKISGEDGAAAVLGLPSSTLRSKMKRLGISRQES